MKKNVVIISWNGENEVGGVEQVTYYMHQAWKEKFDVTIIDFDMVRTNKFCKFFLGIHYYIDAWIVSFFANSYVKKLRKMYGTENVIVVSQGFNAPGMRADISFAHGTMRGYKIAIAHDYKWHFSELYEKMAWNRATRVIAVGDSVKEEAIRFYKVNPDKIQVLENCVNTDSFYPIERVSEEKVCNIIFVGRLEPGKGLDKLQELAAFIEGNSNYRLLIATTSEDGDTKFANLKNTQVYINIKRSEMNAFYNKGNIMFFPTLYEGFGLVTLESLAAGIPVVGSDVALLGKFVKEGRAGVVILSENVADNLELIRNLADEFRDIRKRELLHKDIEQTFSYSIYLKKLELMIKDA